MESNESKKKALTDEKREYYRQRIIKRIKSCDREIKSMLAEVRAMADWIGIGDNDRVRMRLNAVDVDFMNLLDTFEDLNVRAIKYVGKNNDHADADTEPV